MLQLMVHSGIIAVIVLSYIGVSPLLEVAGDAVTRSEEWRLIVGVTIVLALIVLLVFAVVRLLVQTISAARHAYGEARRAAGRFTPQELAQREAIGRADVVMRHASAFRAALIDEQVPPAIRIWDLQLERDEIAFADGPATYARHYGADVTYQQSSGFYVGSPAFVLAGMAATAIGNASARSAAQRQAAAQWREWQTVRTIVTNKRIRCQVGMQWLSFDFAAVTAAYPDPVNQGLTLLFDSSSPLLLQGEPITIASILVIAQLHGAQGLVEHPALQVLP